MRIEDRYPRQFNVDYQKPGFNSFISFNIYRDANGPTWNGYYKEHRIRLWWNGYFWIVAGYSSGIEACYFRCNDEENIQTKISKLIQCACFYIDSLTEINEKV